MKLSKESAIYETSNSDLATFLLLQGIELLECVPSPTNSRVVLMRFLDNKGQCLDLEQVFLRSEFKRYRELHKWLLDRIFKIVNKRG